ncbi:MAG TPA: HAD-IA family hydrolase [Mycobacteriales bacterium]|nr:HAD-IA family hydrolase [Mycobacteriales bacterium]
MTITLACLDMAGTTVADDGVVNASFDAAMRAVGVDAGSERWVSATQIVEATMGQSKIAVFTRIFGDAETAERANQAFEDAYAEAVAAGQVNAIPGARELLDKLRAGGTAVCLTTGFSPVTRDQILDCLGWGDAVDLVLSPGDAGRGRPWPDMIWTAALQLQADRMSEVAVVGDTPSDIETGRRAGAGLVVGVLTGAGSEADLRAAGADEVVTDVTELADLATRSAP